MQGNVGILNHFEVAGFSWIGNDRHDHVMIMVNGEEVATVPANRFRSDLRMAGVGDGRSAFKFAFADVPGIFKSVEIEALSKESGRHLPNGKRTLQPLLDGGAPFRHSLARRCVAFVPTRMVRQGNRIVVIARAILPTDSEMTVVSVGSCEGSQGESPVDDLKIVPETNSDLPEGAPTFRNISWSFDVRSFGGSTVASFRLRGAERDADLIGDRLFEAMTTACIPLKTDWFTTPSAENYTRTSGNIADINTLMLGATTHGYRVDAISQLMLNGQRKNAVLDWGVGFGRTAMPIKRIFNRDAV